MNEFGSWDDFVSVVNRKGHAWRSLLGQDRGQVWVPGLSFGGGTTGITYSSQQGKFWKLGDIVMCSFLVVLSSKGTSAGSALLTGLPFQLVDGFSTSFTIRWGAMATTLYNVFGTPSGAGTTVPIEGVSAATATPAALQATDFNNNSSLIGMFFYGAYP